MTDGMRARAGVVLLVALLASCGGGSSSSDAPVRIVVSSLLSDMPVVIAAEEGHFADEGVEIAFERTQSVAEMVPLLESGEIDVWVGSPTPALFAMMAAGVPVRVVADKGHVGTDCAYFAFVVRDEVVAEPGWDEPDALTGRTFSVGSTAVQPNIYLDRVLAAHGLDRSDVTVEHVAYPTTGEAVASGQVHVGMIPEPLLSRALQGGGLQTTMPSQDVVPGMQIATIVFGPRLVEDDPDLGERVMRAYLKGVEQYAEGPTDRNIAIIGEETGLSDEILRTACWPAIRRDGSINAQSLVEAQEWAVEHDMQDDVVPAETFWDPRFVDAARSTAG